MNPLEVSPTDYHKKLRCNRANVLDQDSYLSKSVIWELANASLFSWRYHPKEFSPTASMQWGSLVDCLTTAPEEFEDAIAVSPYDSFRSKEAREWRDATLSSGKTITTNEELEEAKKAALMLTERNHESARIFDKSKTQVIIHGSIEGANVKGLVDLAPEGEEFLADLKTTADFSLDGFAKTTAKFGYHVQAGLYLALWNVMFPKDQRERFRLIWQNSSPPYEVSVTEMSRNDIEAGLIYAVHLVERIVKATKTDRWPMLLEGVVPVITRPAWASMAEEATIEREEHEPKPQPEIEEIA